LHVKVKSILFYKGTASLSEICERLKETMTNIKMFNGAKIAQLML